MRIVLQRSCRGTNRAEQGDGRQDAGAGGSEDEVTSTVTGRDTEDENERLREELREEVIRLQG